MRHLFSHSVYQDASVFGYDLGSTLSRIGCDGLELLTSHAMEGEAYLPYTETVHLPFAHDWLAAWEGRPYDMPDDSVPYLMFGRTRDEVVQRVSEDIMIASAFSPTHGVMHASNVSLCDVWRRTYSDDSRHVIRSFCEMMNTVVGSMPGGEPPFRLAFENLWWPGLRLLDESDYRLLESNLEFEDWCICLDTGHLMNLLPDIYTEKDGVDALLDIFYGYSRDLVERIRAIHFHYSASYGYRSTFEERSMDCDAVSFIGSAYPHVSMIDQHLPFSEPRCVEILDVLEPDIVVHELPGNEKGPLEDFVKQRTLIG
ncbi:MAG: sugar phosphate isomerase/epimerase [Candidatus Methanomethylophilaceae archaeon]|nr:sugar phosphate isomerase/epimerase [Candidatus Methanomethylophilaceae archaeon]